MTATITLTHAKSLTVGDPVRVTVSVDVPSNATLRWRSPTPAKDVVRLSVSPWSFQRDGASWRLSRHEVWAPFASNMDVQLPYGYRIERYGTPIREVSLASPAFHVGSVLGSEAGTATAAPLAEPWSRPYVSPYQAAGLFLAVAALALVFRKIRPAARKERAGPKTPEEIFEQELSLLDRQLTQEEPAGPFYDWLAEITRWYLEQKLAIPAAKLTSSEIVRDLSRDGRALPSSEIGAVFSACDGFRFARREQRSEQAREAIGQARRAGELIRAALSPTVPDAPAASRPG
jgi:hypothetical protein